jgi:hypothetical protein
MWEKLSETCILPDDSVSIIVGVASTKQTASSMDLSSI